MFRFDEAIHFILEWLRECLKRWRYDPGIIVICNHRNRIVLLLTCKQAIITTTTRIIKVSMSSKYTQILMSEKALKLIYMSLVARLDFPRSTRLCQPFWRETSVASNSSPTTPTSITYAHEQLIAKRTMILVQSEFFLYEIKKTTYAGQSTEYK